MQAKIETKTAIIGAGMSGIAAAVNFLEKNYDQFLVLEANERIGGRCHTIYHENHPIEFGAQYIHGQLGNPIFHFSKENNLISPEYFQITDDENDLGLISNLDEDDSVEFFTENKDKIPGRLNQRINQLIDQLIVESKTKLDFEKIGDNESIGDFWLNSLEEMVKKEFTEEARDPNFMKIVYGIFDWRCKVENMYSGCETVFELSLKNYRNYENLKGCKAIQIKQGYKSVIDKLLEKHEAKFNQNLRLGHVLGSILLCTTLGGKTSENCEHCQYTRDRNKIVLKLTKKATDQVVIVVCDHVICTVSLGVLKERLEKMVKPVELIPREKLDAISRLGFGTINKIFLIYEKPFWKEIAEEINFIRLFDKEKLLSGLNHKYDTKNLWWIEVCNVEESEYNENMLIVWMGGSHDHESLSDERIIADLNSEFKKFLSLESVPNPVKIIRSKWNSNENFRGSYSFCRVGGRSNDHEELSQPIEFNNKPFIQFAGEATHKEWFSTVHGAYQSGIRESNRILNQV